MTLRDTIDMLSMLAATGFAAALLGVALRLARWLYGRQR